ncbi:NAD(P)-binding domain-containing protein [Sulfitobacter aestuariivivens]|uniref:NAD(P)-binding domain-containing protein n=1 Tax=Sulfitobacter aestuariivivens TaxID=2766981 RepID=UPI0036162674
MRIGFIGTGEIAGYMVRGLAGRGHQIRVSARNAQKAAALAKEVAGVEVAENAEIVARSDVVFLCLMAGVARDVLPTLPFRADQAVVSVMTDMPLAALHELCAPAVDIACTIPLSAIATGGRCCRFIRNRPRWRRFLVKPTPWCRWHPRQRLTRISEARRCLRH